MTMTRTRMATCDRNNYNYIDQTLLAMTSTRISAITLKTTTTITTRQIVPMRLIKRLQCQKITTATVTLEMTMTRTTVPLTLTKNFK
jgi:hypothetical protein